MVTKAIHLELITDLTSEAFIAALKRFCSRRGKCSKLFSDNATNFVGACAELKKLQRLAIDQKEPMAQYLAKENIEWKFLPPRAPNFGGLWEAGVKSFKYHFKRVVGNDKLTYEQFLTVVIQIEGILNSRPLSSLSSDIDDLQVLTPGHFLIGRPNNAIVEPDITDIPDNRLKLWKRVTKIVQLIWKRWHMNYLSHLQNRSKWTLEKDNLKVGTMVLIKDDNLPCLKWAIGRITEVFYGKDDKIRVCNVKTSSGVLKRPVTKLCVLPIEEENK